MKALDLIGEKFNKLTVLHRADNTKNGMARWVCECDCGNKSIVVGAKLKNGSTKSCGCAKSDAQKRKTEDLTGKKFNRLTVIKMTGYKRNNAVCECRCDCGKVIKAMAYDVKVGHTKSCGCLNAEHARVANFKHGHTTTDTASRTYRSWRSMKQRCNEPSQVGYHNYGGRGITVCERWMNSFDNFLEDMGERPKDMTLDRKNNDGNYEPLNCRWADKDTQSMNKRAGLTRKKRSDA